MSCTRSWRTSKNIHERRGQTRAQRRNRRVRWSALNRDLECFRFPCLSLSDLRFSAAPVGEGLVDRLAERKRGRKSGGLLVGGAQGLEGGLEIEGIDLE